MKPDPQTISWLSFQESLDKFNNELQKALQILGIEAAASKLPIDHACIRLNTPEQAEALLEEVIQVGTVISTEEINGRPIHIVELDTPLMILDRPVTGLEIPYPKPGQQYPVGFEHVEFVLPNVKENTADGILRSFFSYFLPLERERLDSEFQFKVSEPGTETDQLPNPTVGLKVNGLGLKFHAHPIQKVVGYLE